MMTTKLKLSEKSISELIEIYEEVHGTFTDEFKQKLRIKMRKLELGTLY